MEFDEIIVKESPGLCRCCLSEGCYKDLGSEYTWMNETEVYADMLLECFDIGISQHNDGPNGPNRLICEVCITRLRDACNFKKQVLDSEKKFVDMVGRGEFRPKVMVYQAMMKAETLPEEALVEDGEVEYLDEIFEEEPLKSDDVAPEASVSDDISLAALAKGKRGRPKKNSVKSEKKVKVAKLDDKPKTSRTVTRGLNVKREVRDNYLGRLGTIRRNIVAVLRYGTVLPFQWSTRGYRCFYCAKPMRNCDTLREHTILKHPDLDLEAISQKIISKDVPIKMDVTDLGCKVCDLDLNSLEELISHITLAHQEMYDQSAGVCIFPFVLHKELMKCVLCDIVYDNFTCMMTHMYRDHIKHSFICQICGLSFINTIRLKRHISNSHIGHKCSICQKLFDGFHRMERHKERIHGQIKTHECDLCPATFDNNYQVKVHMGKVHNVDKYRIKCEHCPKITTTKGAMMLHVQSVHSDIRYECDICDYKTGIKWMIKLHKRKHFGVKDYACSVCDRKFGRSSNVRAHMKVHTGNFGRVCRWCRQGFTDLETLNKHEMDIHYYEHYI